ncbi:hypothetical protein P3S67_028582 [Capsicum chacoense]
MTFSFTIYLSYLIYAPLYIAGPIISFNAFASLPDAYGINDTFLLLQCICH